MADARRILILSDIHFAGRSEIARGLSYEMASSRRPWVRFLLRAWRSLVWRRDPFGHNAQVDRFLEQAPEADLVVANGDFSCDTAYVGVGDPAAFESADEVLTRLRQRFAPRFQATFGDHELGKRSLGGDAGGMRLNSWRAAVEGLKIQPLWQEQFGRYRFIGVVSSLIAFPVYECECLPEERAEWEKLRENHLRSIAEILRDLAPSERVILFCHDPTALPFLWEMPEVQQRIGQVERTIIGHLHSPIFLWQSRLLSGMPTIRFLGNAIRRMSAAVQRAALWKPFKVLLCPALSGIELHGGGGYFELEIYPDEDRPVRFQFRRLNRC